LKGQQLFLPTTGKWNSPLYFKIERREFGCRQKMLKIIWKGRRYGNEKRLARC
jgi:hypothetical protein